MTGNSDSKKTQIVKPARGSSRKAAGKVDDTAPTKVVLPGKSGGKSTSAEPPANTTIIGLSDSNDSGDSLTTGWLVIVDGPGKGTSFPLGYANNTIGRNADQTVRLALGDSSISGEHAVIIFDDRKAAFHIARESAKNNIYLNDDLVIDAKKLKHGDRISFGETTAMFVPLCGSKFSWNDAAG